MLIDTQQRFDDLLEVIGRQRELAVDCEMDSMYAYRTSLCLVQVGWDGGEALIDGLVPLQWGALGRIFADPAVTKVFHGGENDIGLMRSHWGLQFDGIFDTMSASQVLGHDGVGLAALLERHFGIHVSKKFQKADWRVRPLPDAQAEYARVDVRHLIALRRLLETDLSRLARLDEARSEFRRVSRACAEERPFDPGSWARIRGARELPADRRATLAQLYVARDEIARALDRAPYRVLNESVLVELAHRQPATSALLRRVSGVSAGLSSDQVDLLLAAIERGRAVTDLPLPRSLRAGGERFGGGPMLPEEVALFDALRAWRQRRAATRGVDVARVATNALLSAIVRSRPSTLDALAAVPGMEEWRLREYATEILDVLAGAASRGPAGAPAAAAFPAAAPPSASAPSLRPPAGADPGRRSPA